MRIKIFRWKAIGPLLLLLLVIGVLVVLFAEPVARDTTEEVSTELLGTQVDVGRLDLLPRQASVDLGALQVADPFEPRRNLVEADRIVLKLNPEALAEKKLVVERFALQGMRFGTTRKTPARPVKRQRLRTPGASRRPGMGPAVRRADPAAHADRHHQAARAQSGAARYRAGGAGAPRADRLDPAGAGAGVQVDRHRRHGGFRSGARRPAVEDRSPRRLASTARARPFSRCSRRLKQLDAARKQVDGLQRNVTQGVKLLGSGRERPRRGAETRLRLRQVPPQAADLLGPGHRQRVLRQGQHRPVPAGALLGRAGAPLHAARTASAGGRGPQAPAGLGGDRALSEGAQLAELPDAAGAGGLHDRRRPAQGRLRGHRAGPHLGARAVRQAHARGGEARRARLGDRRARRRRGGGPPDGQRARLGRRPGSGACSSPRSTFPGCRSGSRRAPARPTSTSRSAATSCWAAGRSAASRWPGRSTAPAGRQQRSRAARLAGGLGAQAARRECPGERPDQGAEAVGEEQPRRRDRAAAQGRRRRGGGQGRGAWPGPRWTASWRTRSSR